MAEIEESAPEVGIYHEINGKKYNLAALSRDQLNKARKDYEITITESNTLYKALTDALTDCITECADEIAANRGKLAQVMQELSNREGSRRSEELLEAYRKGQITDYLAMQRTLTRWMNKGAASGPTDPQSSATPVPVDLVTEEPDN